MTTNPILPTHEEMVGTKSRVSRGLLAGGLVFFMLASATTAFAFYTLRFEEKALPGVTIGGISVTGMNESQIKEALNTRFTDMINKDLSLSYNAQVKSIHLETSEDPDLNLELITLNAENSARTALSYGHRGAWYQRAYEGLRAPITKTILAPDLTINETVLAESVHKAFAEIEDPGKPTDFVFDPTFTSVTIENGTRGKEIDISSLFTIIRADLSDLVLEQTPLAIIDSPEPLTTAQASSVASDALALLAKAPIELTYTTDTKREYTWSIDQALLADALVPVGRPLPGHSNEPLALGLDLEEAKLNPLFLEIEKVLNVSPTDARFQVENGKVVEFAGSTNGVAFDRELTLGNILANLQGSTTTPGVVTLSVKTTEPDTKTSEVNDLGISEVLGVGTSSWHGSPKNRIGNIRHATEKLNGLLFAPGERVSLVSKLGPLTLEDGYLPELIILGDEIKPEIAGGLCQIGTTTFRAVMNAGLQVDERRNHSLLVSYYNDPSNGNPGTDAALYEPHPDLQFTNTTGNYILLTTEFDEKGEQLIYTFWGTSDGRKAYYTAPQVLNWYPAGEPVNKPSTTIPVGTTKCQAVHPGASTTFNYIIEYPDGTNNTQKFDSYYRPLPKICLVGVDPNAPPPEPAPIVPPAPEAPLPPAPIEIN